MLEKWPSCSPFLMTTTSTLTGTQWESLIWGLSVITACLTTCITTQKEGFSELKLKTVWLTEAKQLPSEPPCQTVANLSSRSRCLQVLSNIIPTWQKVIFTFILALFVFNISLFYICCLFKCNCIFPPCFVKQNVLYFSTACFQFFSFQMEQHKQKYLANYQHFFFCNKRWLFWITLKRPQKTIHKWSTNISLSTNMYIYICVMSTKIQWRVHTKQFLLIVDDFLTICGSRSICDFPFTHLLNFVCHRNIKCLWHCIMYRLTKRHLSDAQRRTGSCCNFSVQI